MLELSHHSTVVVQNTARSLESSDLSPGVLLRKTPHSKHESVAKPWTSAASFSPPPHHPPPHRLTTPELRESLVSWRARLHTIETVLRQINDIQELLQQLLPAYLTPIIQKQVDAGGLFFRTWAEFQRMLQNLRFMSRMDLVFTRDKVRNRYRHRHRHRYRYNSIQSVGVRLGLGFRLRG